MGCVNRLGEAKTGELAADLPDLGKQILLQLRAVGNRQFVAVNCPLQIGAGDDVVLKEALVLVGAQAGQDGNRVEAGTDDNLAQGAHWGIAPG